MEGLVPSSTSVLRLNICTSISATSPSCKTMYTIFKHNKLLNMRKTQIKKMNLLIAFIFFSQVVFSQTNTAQETNRTPTFEGWEDLIWGSTETDVMQKYESQLTILETVSTYDNGEYYCPFEIQNYKINRYDNFTVSFLFDEKTKKLAVVNVTMENPKNILNILQDTSVPL